MQKPMEAALACEKFLAKKLPLELLISVNGFVSIDDRIKSGFLSKYFADVSRPNTSPKYKRLRGLSFEEDKTEEEEDLGGERMLYLVERNIRIANTDKSINIWTEVFSEKGQGRHLRARIEGGDAQQQQQQQQQPQPQQAETFVLLGYQLLNVTTAEDEDDTPLDEFYINM